jgi:hypothetical protein
VLLFTPSLFHSPTLLLPLSINKTRKLSERQEYALKAVLLRSKPSSNTRQPMDRLVLPRSDSAGPQFMIPLPR